MLVSLHVVGSLAAPACRKVDGRNVRLVTVAGVEAGFGPGFLGALILALRVGLGFAVCVMVSASESDLGPSRGCLFTGLTRGVVGESASVSPSTACH